MEKQQNNEQIEKLNRFRQTWKKFLSTEDGKFVAKMLVELYVDQSALDLQNSDLTYYRLGQKEFVQGLIKDANYDEVEELNKMYTGE